jgi:predicted lactoylglutathione lyase
MNEAAAANGVIADIDAKQGHGFMYNRIFDDPDGHVWEATRMNSSAVPARSAL